MNLIKMFLWCVAIFLLAAGCSTDGLNSDSNNDTSLDQTVVDLAQTSGQLASGTSFEIVGSSSDSAAAINCRPGPNGRRGNGRHNGILDGLSLLAPTDELLAIVDAESASDFRGLRISKSGGATITNYNAAGETVSLPISATDGPQGCSFSGHQFPVYDSLLATIAKTVIDFGSGVTFRRDTVKITRSGKIVITRSVSGATKTEVTTFDNYKVNGIGIAGTKTRVSTFDSSTGSGTSTTSVADGKITLADGTVATWTSEKSRVSDITLDETTLKPTSGTITTTVDAKVVTTDGTVIYSHKTNAPLVENVACGNRRRGPVSGKLETVYRTDTVQVDFGDGTCTNKTITITFNGVTSTKTIGE
ncbi:hypothetical protein SAMN04488109_1568 [Chryseolinea serpens]|uniref:Lipoprotein n=1 Tax=Chryseolinea serpens TaxID=947013 RepID=A0A1M5M5P2_9BACT|nr:hypothetical protein [Chryseolinea serpens]SHG72538.1 hypothetical protein SAMN04488109_1568 [Chryseolinea serpens]